MNANHGNVCWTVSRIRITVGLMHATDATRIRARRQKLWSNLQTCLHGKTRARLGYVSRARLVIHVGLLLLSMSGSISFAIFSAAADIWGHMHAAQETSERWHNITCMQPVSDVACTGKTLCQCRHLSWHKIYQTKAWTLISQATASN